MTSLALVTLTAPINSLAASSVIALPLPASSVVVPVIARLPLSVIAPADVSFFMPVCH